jgi:glycosyltransferase involved in cell wall biosynthesis
MQLSIIIPAKNEAKSLAIILPALKELYPDAQIIVINDGSTDQTVEISKLHEVEVINHPYSKGNGAAIKSGLRAARCEVVVCMDADGQHMPQDIPLLVAKLNEGYDMVVGARNHEGQANVHRSLANGFYNGFSSWMVGHKIHDLTSGFRAIKRKRFLEFISLLPNKFSYPTTITMSFFRSGYSVAYVPIHVKKRIEGTVSHVNLWRDGVRFLIIIFKIGILFSPLKLFFPISLSLLFLGTGYYVYTFIETHRFTNMSALLLTTSILVFLMGLISEQITSLIYKDKA